MQEKIAEPYREYVAVPHLIHKHVRPALAVPTKLRTFGLGHTKNTYTGARDTRRCRETYGLGDFIGPGALFGPGWRKESFDGQGMLPVTDDEGRVVVSMCAGPADPTWMPACTAAVEHIQAARDRIHTSAVNWLHRRGDFLAMAHGVLYGGSQKVRPLVGPSATLLMPASISALQTSSTPLVMRLSLSGSSPSRR